MSLVFKNSISRFCVFLLTALLFCMGALPAYATQDFHTSDPVLSTFDSDTVAADVVFILDMSTTMSFISTGKDITDSDGGTQLYRIEAMVRAVNDAIASIMAANPQNRVAVYWYGGPVNNDHVGTLMPLGSYTFSSGSGTEYLVWSSSNTANMVTNENLLRNGTSYPRVEASTRAGTPLQDGIIYAVQNTIQEIAGSDYTSWGNREPFVFVFSDSAASIGDTNWWQPYSQNGTAVENFNRPTNDPNCIMGNVNTGSKEVAAATLLTATHQKDQLTQAYRTYNQSGGTTDEYLTNFYTVGLGSDTAINGDTNYTWAALNPAALNTPFEVEGGTSNSPSSIVAVNTKAQIATFVETAVSVEGNDFEKYSNPEVYTYSNYYTFTNTYPRLEPALSQLVNDVSAAPLFADIPIAISITKDGAPWTDAPPTISLDPGSGGNVVTDLSSVSGGTYKVLANGINTGKTVVVERGKETSTPVSLDYYTLEVRAGTGSSNPVGSGVYLVGSKVSISVSLQSGYELKNWISSVHGFVAPQAASTTITMPDSPLTLTANVTFVGNSADSNSRIPATGDSTPLALLAAAVLAGTLCMLGKRRVPTR